MKQTEKRKVDPLLRAKAYDALDLLFNAPLSVPGFDVVGFGTDIATYLGYIKPDEEGEE